MGASTAQARPPNPDNSDIALPPEVVQPPKRKRSRNRPCKRPRVWLSPDAAATLHELMVATGHRGMTPALELLIRLVKEAGFRVP